MTAPRIKQIAPAVFKPRARNARILLAMAGWAYAGRPRHIGINIGQFAATTVI